MYLWYYSTRAFARNSFHATRPEIHGARQICIQSYNINNVFLHFIISRRIHATFCTMVVFIRAALYSETSGLQPIKYAVRPVFWNILIIFSICWSVLGYGHRCRSGVRVSRRISCFQCPKAMDLSLFFSLIKRFWGLTQLFFLCRPAPAFSRLSHKRFLQ